jgi:hypothetical protein
VSLTWRAMGLADVARYVIYCRKTQETRVHIRVDDLTERERERNAFACIERHQAFALAPTT